MSKKHQKTLQAIFKKPIPAGIKWDDIEALFSSLGAKISEGRGSRLRIELNEEDAVFHKPHPRKEVNKGSIVSIRRFLENAGVKP